MLQLLCPKPYSASIGAQLSPGTLARRRLYEAMAGQLNRDGLQVGVPYILPTRAHYRTKLGVYLVLRSQLHTHSCDSTNSAVHRCVVPCLLPSRGFRAYDSRDATSKPASRRGTCRLRAGKVATQGLPQSSIFKVEGEKVCSPPLNTLGLLLHRFTSILRSLPAFLCGCPLGLVGSGTRESLLR